MTVFFRPIVIFHRIRLNQNRLKLSAIRGENKFRLLVVPFRSDPRVPWFNDNLELRLSLETVNWNLEKCISIHSNLMELKQQQQIQAAKLARFRQKYEKWCFDWSEYVRRQTEDDKEELDDEYHLTNEKGLERLKQKESLIDQIQAEIEQCENELKTY